MSSPRVTPDMFLRHWKATESGHDFAERFVAAINAELDALDAAQQAQAWTCSQCGLLILSMGSKCPRCSAPAPSPQEGTESVVKAARDAINEGIQRIYDGYQRGEDPEDIFERWHEIVDDVLDDVYAAANEPLRCHFTKNPCGTDTRPVGHPCPCQNCRKYTASLFTAPPAIADKQIWRRGEWTCRVAKDGERFVLYFKLDGIQMDHADYMLPSVCAAILSGWSLDAPEADQGANRDST